MKSHRLPLLALFLSLGCGGTPASDLPEYPPFEVEENGSGSETTEVEAPREPPPEPGESRDVRFPPVTHRTLANGLAVDVIEARSLPVAHVTFLVRSGGVTDPETLPGLASFVADMLKEGTTSKTSAELAGAFDALGAHLSVGADQESVQISVAVLADELPAALALLAEMITQPSFDETELGKLKRRELDRLELEARDPNWQARRAFRREIYGNHPYARLDTTPEAIEHVTRADLQAWHRAHVVPSNAVLIVAGDVDPASFATAATRAFRRFRGGSAPTIAFPTVAPRTTRTVTVVDRPGSVQSVIRVGNLAIARRSPDFVPLSVANHVLGGGGSARLFVDLRETRGLTYGAYSSVVELTEAAPFAVATSVRTPVTVEAIGAIMEHLTRITSEPIPDDELGFARRYLSDSFPLQIDTPGKIVQLVAEAHVFGLPENYWDGYRTAIASVTADEALAAATRDIRPSEAAIVIVGEASAFAEALTQWGPVRIVDVEGHLIRELAATPSN